MILRNRSNSVEISSDYSRALDCFDILMVRSCTAVFVIELLRDGHVSFHEQVGR